MKNLPSHIINPNPEIYLSNNYSTYDLETTNEDKGSAICPTNELLLSCNTERTDGGRRISCEWDSESKAKRYVDRLSGFDFIICHNAKFELQWFKRLGCEIDKLIVWDTQVVEYIIKANRRWRLDLSTVAKRWGLPGKSSLVSILIKAGINPKLIPKSWLLTYCIEDVLETEELFKRQLEYCIANNLLPVVLTKCLFTVVLAEIEMNGVCVDKERTVKEYEEFLQEFITLDRQLAEIAPINWNSGPQRGKVIYEDLGFKELTHPYTKQPIRTPTGRPITKEDKILQLKATNKKQRNFLEIYKRRVKVASALSKTLDFFYGVVNERKDNVFYGQFNQTVTATLRLSSSGRPQKFNLFDKPKSAQFQNFPRQFKKLFRARRKGWLIGEVDGAQLEFRTAAQLGQDRAAIEDIVNGVDVHRVTADTLTEAGEPTSRQDAKSRTFKPLFGGTTGTNAEQAYFKSFRARYPGIAETQQRWIDTVLAEGQLTLPTGVVFYWPDTKVLSSGYIKNNNDIHNYPIQYFAGSEIIPISIIYQYHRMKAAGMESFLVNTIHDSSIGEINPNEVELYEEIAVKAFTTDVYYYMEKVYNIKFVVPLGVEVKIGEFLTEGKEQKYDIPAPYNL